MINTEEFIKRLEIILEYYSISASVFADRIGVQRSGLSHLLSGRNKPSLDFVMRIIENHPEVDLYWLLNGNGSFPKNENTQEKTTPPAPALLKKIYEEQSQDLFSTDEIFDIRIEEKAKQDEVKSLNNIPDNKPIDKIVVFYKDGTFKSYKELT